MENVLIHNINTHLVFLVCLVCCQLRDDCKSPCTSKMFHRACCIPLFIPTEAVFVSPVDNVLINNYYFFSVGWQLRDDCKSSASVSKINNVDEDDELKAICDEERLANFRT